MLTGAARYADLLERTLYNGFLAGLSLDGKRYIYANPLQVRDGHVASGDDGDHIRAPWFRCACCPPNVMRLLASLEHYVLLGDATSLTLHQFVTGSYAAEVGGGGPGCRSAPTTPGTAASGCRSRTVPRRRGRWLSASPARPTARP